MKTRYKIMFSTLIILLLVMLVSADNGVFDNTNYNSNNIYGVGSMTSTTVVTDTVNTGQGANELYDMNQNVLTTDAVIFATVDTGNGATEIYDMNQDVRYDDAVVFTRVTANTMSTGNGQNELYEMNQDVKTTDDVVFNEVETPKIVLSSASNMCIIVNGTDIIIANDLDGVTC